MISVIMLTYNRKKYVIKMIEDILKQTYTDYEFVIVNNGSTDGTDDVLSRYAQKDGRIKIFEKTAGSVGAGRNFGLRVSQGECVTFVDDDDRVQDDFLEFLYLLMDQEKVDISMCGATEFIGGGVKPQCLFDEKLVVDGKEALNHFLKREYIRAGMPTKLFRREVLEKYPFCEMGKHEDIHTVYKYFGTAARVALWGKDKYRFVRHGANLSFFTSDQSQWTEAGIREYKEAFSKRTEWVSALYPDMAVLAKYSELSYIISMIDKIKKYKVEGCQNIEKELMGIMQKAKGEFLNMPYIKDFEIKWIDEYIA